MRVHHLTGQPTGSNWPSQNRITTHSYGPVKMGDNNHGYKCMEVASGLPGGKALVTFEFCKCIVTSSTEEASVTNQCIAKGGAQLWAFFDHGDMTPYGNFKFMRVQRNAQNTGILTNTELTPNHCLKWHKDDMRLEIEKVCSYDASNLFRINPNFDALSLAADPLAVNIKGQRFNVNTVGGVTLLRIPRDADLDKAYLVIVAHIQELGRKNSTYCPPTYMRHLLITGTVLGKLKALSFHARNYSSPFLFGLGMNDWLTDGHITQSAIEKGTMDMGSKQALSVYIDEDPLSIGFPKAIVVKIQQLLVKVSRPHVPEGKQWQFLNLHVHNMQRLNYSFHDIGGIFGSDSQVTQGHSSDACLSITRRLRMNKKGMPLAAHVSALQEAAIGDDGDGEEDPTFTRLDGHQR
eukprot:gnl/TRDRNA2_/TRDRNA2_60066_c0_seq1.p1 gnl/TRDRNA2_/TRDRNA2_60066_c0~~gnl/TRDRNA2_/TRDRNA2_60066_c0_seq1.p1  ORF type:complete len:451 (-),score=49.02 gnl/TRDRNA2_/TRDRNA2_60066_c0_seq1:6-1223(-)